MRTCGIQWPDPARRFISSKEKALLFQTASAFSVIDQSYPLMRNDKGAGLECPLIVGKVCGLCRSGGLVLRGHFVEGQDREAQGGCSRGRSAGPADRRWPCQSRARSEAEATAARLPSAVRASAMAAQRFASRELLHPPGEDARQLSGSFEGHMAPGQQRGFRGGVCRREGRRVAPAPADGSPSRSAARALTRARSSGGEKDGTVRGLRWRRRPGQGTPRRRRRAEAHTGRQGQRGPAAPPAPAERRAGEQRQAPAARRDTPATKILQERPLYSPGAEEKGA